jgi:uncharacterized protein (DUF1684 family)
MNNNLKFGITFLLIAILVALTVSCSNSDPQAKYVEDINNYRQAVKSFFRDSADSPIAGMDKKTIPFYYNPKPEYKVEAYLKIFDKQDTLDMLTTQSDVRKMIRYGKLSFVVNNDKHELTVYVNIEYPESFFIPFYDQTNDEETYGAGRYLDIERTKGDKYTLDFNLAYNPYCYYNPKYSCPIVPEENTLKTKIEAGEKAHNDLH